MLGEVTEVVKTGVWVGDCFLFTNNLNRLNYYVGGEIVTVAHLEKALYLLGYLSDVNRVFLADKELNVISYALELSVLQYQDRLTKPYTNFNRSLDRFSLDNNFMALFLLPFHSKLLFSTKMP